MHTGDDAAARALTRRCNELARDRPGRFGIVDWPASGPRLNLTYHDDTRRPQVDSDGPARDVHHPASHVMIAGWAQHRIPDRILLSVADRTWRPMPFQGP